MEIERIRGLQKDVENMIQSKKHKHLEVWTNQILGIVTGWAVVMWIFPLLSTLSQVELATVSSFIFFTFSYVRMLTVRSILDELNIRRYHEV